MTWFRLYDEFVHRDGRHIAISTIVHDPPQSHGIAAAPEQTYNSETLITTWPRFVLAGDEDASRHVALLAKHDLPGARHDIADWERVAAKHAAIVKRARRGRRRCRPST